MTKAKVKTSLVLIGGGHSHAIALKLWGMNPLPGVRLTLISDVSQTPYSGMLPGYIAGFYSFAETHINLPPLARFAGAEFYCDRAISLDLANQKVICANQSAIAFDLLSIDIGSTPTNETIIGAEKYTIPAKPVPQFLAAWHQILETVSQPPETPLIIAIVGGGAGGIELALNMQSRLHNILKQAGQPLNNISLHLFHRHRQLLPHHNPWVSHRLEKILLERNIVLHLQQNVKEIVDNLATKDCYKIKCESGLEIAAHKTILVTQAAAPSWLKASGLATDSQGFILVRNTLQAKSHSQIFAAGDIATMENYNCPKAGVFAVRQGKPLLENIQRLILGKSLQPYLPQKHYLSLIGTGDKKAIASWSVFGWESPLLWSWKDYIDRKFMKGFDNLS